MPKFTPSPVGNFNTQGLLTLQANLDAIEEAFDNTISRDGSIPNQMEADLDLNNNDLLNVDELSAEVGQFGSLFVNGVDIGSGAAPVFADNATSIATKSMAQVWSPEIAPSFVRLEGYAAAGDGGGALYKNVGASEPTHIGKFQSADGTWWEIVEMRVDGLRQINPLAYGIFPSDNVNDRLKELFEGPAQAVPLENACVRFPPGDFYIDDFVFVWGDNVEVCGAGAKLTLFHQATWGRGVFATGRPGDNVPPDPVGHTRPVGLKFHDFGGVAYNNGVKCYYWDGQFGPTTYLGEDEFVITADPSATVENNLFVFRNNDLEDPDSVTGVGTDSWTITLTSPIGAGDNIVIKITNKDDMFSNDNITYYFNADADSRANESTLVWHGGGDNFEAYNLWADGFVAPVVCYGDWTSDLADRHTSYVKIHDIQYNNCEYVLVNMVIKAEIYNIFGGKVTETQTDNGVRNYQNPGGLIDPTYKDPHVLYFTNSATLSTSHEVYVGVLEADNIYSSNYKFRNIRGLTIRAGVIRSFSRVLDLDTCWEVYGHFPKILGSNIEQRDTQAAALVIRSVEDAVFDIGQLEVIGDTCSAVVFDESSAGICSNVDVHIGRLYTSGTSARSREWIIWRGSADSWAYIKTWLAAGADTGSLARFRDGNDGLGGSVGCSGGGIVVENIRCIDPRSPLRIARLSTELSTTPTGVTVDFDPSAILGTYTFTSATINNAGSGTKIIVPTVGVTTSTTDGAITITPILTNPVFIHSGTLTNNRNITLSATNASLNQRFRIVRTGGGAFDLNVLASATVALAQDTWCDVIYDGSAWQVIGYGALP